MAYIKGIIQIKPTTKARPRLTKTNLAFNTVQTKSEQRKQSFLFDVLARKSKGSFPIPLIPLDVTLRFFHTGNEPNVQKVTTPDIDNLQKLTLDAITKSIIWRDDNQVTRLVSEDFWAGEFSKPRIEIIIQDHILKENFFPPNLIMKGTIPSHPKSKARPRMTKEGIPYNPTTTSNAQKKQAALLAKMFSTQLNRQQIPKKLPLEVGLRFFHSGETYLKPKITVPDIDNLEKLTLDAISNSGIWNDDNQITKLIAEDLWAGDGDSRIEFYIREHKLKTQKTQLNLFG